MALSESALCELLDAFRAGVGVDLIRDAVGLVLQELIELEVAGRIGAAGYERSKSRVSERNGSGPRGLSTQAGDVQLRIPKLRKGSFFSAILEPRRRIDQGRYAVVMEAYLPGISSRVTRRPAHKRTVLPPTARSCRRRSRTKRGQQFCSNTSRRSLPRRQTCALQVWPAHQACRRQCWAHQSGSWRGPTTQRVRLLASRRSADRAR
jgi:hypothetical protein